MSDALTNLEARFRAAELSVRRNPSPYGDGLLAWESVDGPQGLTILHDAVFVFGEAGLWGVWWVGRDRERPDPQFATFDDVVAEVISQNNWSVTLH